MWGWLAAATASAGVTVEDGGGCVDAELVQLELRLVLGDDAVSRSDIDVRLVREGLPWTLTLSVRESTELLWSRDLSVTAADCPYLPTLVARTVEQGLVGVPRWTLGSRRYEVGPDWEVRLAGTVPSAPHVGVGLAFGRRLGGAWHWVVDGELMGTAPMPVDGGSARFGGLILSAGFATHAPLGRSALRLRGTLGGGPVVGVGTGFGPAELLDVAPRMVSTLELAVLFPKVLRLGMRLQTPLVRVAPGLDEGVRGEPEPWVRAGVVLAIGNTK